jgi:hypothetical protein
LVAVEGSFSLWVADIACNKTVVDILFVVLIVESRGPDVIWLAFTYFVCSIFVERQTFHFHKSFLLLTKEVCQFGYLLANIQLTIRIWTSL